MTNMRDEIAEIAYGPMLWTFERGYEIFCRGKDGGNSIAQDEARRAADAIMELVQARIDTLEAELSWYGEQARMSKMRRIWHPRALFRKEHCQLQALSMDGGKRARAVLKGTNK